MGTWLQLPGKVYRHARKERKQGIQPSSSTWLGNAAVTQSRQSRVGSRGPSAEGNSGYDSRSRDVAQRGSACPACAGLGFAPWHLQNGRWKQNKTRAARAQGSVSKMPREGQSGSESARRGKGNQREAHHWSRPAGIASRLVLSSDGGLGPEARVTLALEEVPVDGGQGYPEWKQVQGSFHHTRRVSRQFWVWTTLQRPRGREAMLRTSTLPRAALYHTSQSLEQLRDRLGMRTLGRGTASAPSPQF